MRSLRHRMGSARPPFSPEVPHADSHCTACTGLGNLPRVVAPQLVPTPSRASLAARRRLVGRRRTKDPGRLAAAVPRHHRSLQLGGFPPHQSLVRRRDARSPSAAIKSPGCWSWPKHAACPRSSTSTSMTRSARRTSTPPTSSRSTGSTITTNPPRAGPATTRRFATWNVPCRVGDLTATVDLRLYLRDKTVRRLNRHRPPEHRLHFRSKFHLAREHPGGAETALARGLDRLRPVRQLVCLGDSC